MNAVDRERLEMLEAELGAQPVRLDSPIYLDHPDMGVARRLAARGEHLLVVGPRRAGKTTIVARCVDDAAAAGRGAARVELPPTLNTAKTLVEARLSIVRETLGQLPDGVPRRVPPAWSEAPLTGPFRDECVRRGGWGLVVFDEIQRLRSVPDAGPLFLELVALCSDHDVCQNAILCGAIDPRANWGWSPGAWHTLRAGQLATDTVDAAGDAFGLAGPTRTVLTPIVYSLADGWIYFTQIAWLLALELKLSGVDDDSARTLLPERFAQVVGERSPPATELVRRLGDRMADFRVTILRDLDTIPNTELRRSTLLQCMEVWGAQRAGAVVPLSSRVTSVEARPELHEGRVLFLLGLADDPVRGPLIVPASTLSSRLISIEALDSRLATIDSAVLPWLRRWQDAKYRTAATGFQTRFEAWVPAFVRRWLASGRQRAVLPGGRERKRVLAEVEKWRGQGTLSAIEAEFEATLRSAMAWEQAVLLLGGAVFVSIVVVSLAVIVRSEAARAEAEAAQATADAARATAEAARVTAVATAEREGANAARARAEAAGATARAAEADATAARAAADAARAEAERANAVARAQVATARAEQESARAAAAQNQADLTLATETSARWAEAIQRADTPGAASSALQASLCNVALDDASESRRLSDVVLQTVLTQVGVGADELQLNGSASGAGDGWLAWAGVGATRLVGVVSGHRVRTTNGADALSIVASPDGGQAWAISRPDAHHVRADRLDLATGTATAPLDTPIECADSCADEWGRSFWAPQSFGAPGAKRFGNIALVSARALRSWRTRFRGQPEFPVDAAWASPDGRALVVSTNRGAFQVLLEGSASPNRLMRETWGWRNAREYGVSATIQDNTPLLSLRWTPTGRAFGGLSIDGTAVAYPLDRYGNVNERPLIVAPGPYDHVALLEAAAPGVQPAVSDYLLAATDKTGVLDVWGPGGSLVLRRRVSSGPVLGLTVDHASRTVFVVAASGEVSVFPMHGGTLAETRGEDTARTAASAGSTWRRVATGIDVCRAGCDGPTPTWVPLHRGRVESVRERGDKSRWLDVRSDGRTFRYPLDRGALIATACDRLAGRTASPGTCEHPYLPGGTADLVEVCGRYPREGE